LIEHQLQQLWQDKRLPFHLFRLTNGAPVEIIHTGAWNLAGSGPDFQMAEIQYDNLTWFGSVEFHLKSYLDRNIIDDLENKLSNKKYLFT
jgi:hypothetical protein